MLLHLVDATQDDIATAYKVVRGELKAYSGELAKKKEIVALSKADALDAETLAAKAAELKKASRKTPLVLSAVSGQGVKDALYALTREITKSETHEADPDTPEEPWQP